MTSDATSTDQRATVIEMTGVGVGSQQDLEAHVLEDVNWSVAQGEYWVVAGMDGSGKSNLMSMTAGLMPPRNGSYRLFGHDMPIYEEELLPERLRLGLVFDAAQLFHHLTVAENIALPLHYHRNLTRQEGADRVRAMLELTGLASLANSMPGALGRNWQKRTGLARALMLEPEVLLLDNPLGGLDLRHAGWWLDFLGQLSSGGSNHPNSRRMTLIVTAEDLRPWRNRAGQFAILQKKRFTALGQREKLAGHSEPLVKELLAETTPAD